MIKYYCNVTGTTFYKVDTDGKILRIEIRKYANKKEFNISEETYSADIHSIIARDNEEKSEKAFTKHVDDMKYDLKQITF